MMKEKKDQLKVSPDFEDQIESLDAVVQNMKKALTMQKGIGVEADQDGNRGAAQEVGGEQDYSKFDLVAKKKLLKQIMG